MTAPKSFSQLIAEMEADPSASHNPVSTWILDIRRLARREEVYQARMLLTKEEKAFVRLALKEAILDLHHSLESVKTPDAVPQNLQHVEFAESLYKKLKKVLDL